LWGKTTSKVLKTFIGILGGKIDEGFSFFTQPVAFKLKVVRKIKNHEILQICNKMRKQET